MDSGVVVSKNGATKVHLPKAPLPHYVIIIKYNREHIGCQGKNVSK